MLGVCRLPHGRRQTSGLLDASLRALPRSLASGLRATGLPLALAGSPGVLLLAVTPLPRVAAGLLGSRLLLPGVRESGLRSADLRPILVGVLTLLALGMPLLGLESMSGLLGPPPPRGVRGPGLGGAILPLTLRGSLAPPLLLGATPALLLELASGLLGPRSPLRGSGLRVVTLLLEALATPLLGTAPPPGTVSGLLGATLLLFRALAPGLLFLLPLLTRVLL